MKVMRNLFIALAIALSDVMCLVLAYKYRDMLCGIDHAGYSAPASVAFLYAVPFALGIVVCVIFAIKFHQKTI